MTKDYLLDKYTPGAVPFIPGDDNLPLVNAALAAIPNNARVLVRGLVTVDGGSPTSRGKRGRWIAGEQWALGKTHEVAEGFQTLTDTGGLEPPDARKRAHLLFIDCDDWGTCGLLLRGTKPKTGARRSPSIPSDTWKRDDDPTNDDWPWRTIFEAQHGVEGVASDRGSVIDTVVEDAWGDGARSAGKGGGKTYEPATGFRILRGRFSNYGRCGVTPYCSDFHWQDTLLERGASDPYHIEVSGTGEAYAIRNHVVRNIGVRDLGDNARFSTISSGALVEGIAITDIPGPVAVFINGDRDDDNHPLVRQVRVANNVSPVETPYLVRFRDVAGAAVVNNVFTIQRRNNPYPTGYEFVNCEGVLPTDSNVVTRV